MSNNDGEDDEENYHKIITRWSLQKENTKQAALWDTPPMWSQRILQLCRWPWAGIPKKVPCTPKSLLWCIFQQFYCFHIIIEQNVSLFLSLVINWFSCEFPFRFKSLPHWLHLNVLSPVCVLMCCCQLRVKAKAWLHWLHFNGFSPISIIIMWPFKLSVVMQEYSHLCGFSPECFCLCLSLQAACFCCFNFTLIAMMHFSPVCFLICCLREDFDFSIALAFTFFLIQFVEMRQALWHHAGLEFDG